MNKLTFSLTVLFASSLLALGQQTQGTSTRATNGVMFATSPTRIGFSHTNGSVTGNFDDTGGSTLTIQSGGRVGGNFNGSTNLILRAIEGATSAGEIIGAVAVEVSAFDGSHAGGNLNNATDTYLYSSEGSWIGIWGAGMDDGEINSQEGSVLLGDFRTSQDARVTARSSVIVGELNSRTNATLTAYDSVIISHQPNGSTYTFTAPTVGIIDQGGGFTGFNTNGFTGNGAGLTNVTATAIGTLTNPIVQGGIFGPQSLRLGNSNILAWIDMTNVSIGDHQIGNTEFAVLTNVAPFPHLDGCMGLYFSNRLWRLGGWHEAPYTTNSMWSSTDGATWTYINDAPWAKRHMAGHVVFDNKMWIIGGDKNSGDYQNDVWSSADGTNWVMAATNTFGWNGRILHYVQVFNGKIWLMGGQQYPAGTIYNDVWVSSDATNWSQVTASAPWAARGAIQGQAIHGGKMWIVGGGAYNSTYLNDVWSTPDGTNWTQTTASAPWVGRQYNNAFGFNGRLWVARGGNATDQLGDVWSSTDGATWSQHFSPMISIHAATVISNQAGIVMFGGAGGNMTSNTVWLLSAVTNNQPGLVVSNGMTLLNTNVLVDNNRTLFRNGLANTMRLETNTVTLSGGSSATLVVSNTATIVSLIGSSKSSFNAAKFYNLRTDAEAAVVLGEEAGSGSTPVYFGRFGSTHSTRPLDAEIVVGGSGADLDLATDGIVRAWKSLTATNGLASFSSVAPVAIAATGWTNIWSTNNATVYFDGTTMFWTNRTRAWAAWYTNVAAAAWGTVTLQPGESVQINGTGVTGVAKAF